MYKISLQNLRMMMLDRVESVEKDKLPDDEQKSGDRDKIKRNSIHVLDFVAQREKWQKKQ